MRKRGCSGVNCHTLRQTGQGRRVEERNDLRELHPRVVVIIPFCGLCQRRRPGLRPPRWVTTHPARKIGIHVLLIAWRIIVVDFIFPRAYRGSGYLRASALSCEKGRLSMIAKEEEVPMRGAGDHSNASRVPRCGRWSNIGCSREVRGRGRGGRIERNCRLGHTMAGRPPVASGVCETAGDGPGDGKAPRGELLWGCMANEPRGAEDEMRERATTPLCEAPLTHLSPFT